MKKNVFYYLCAALFSMTMFASCSDDDGEGGDPGAGSAAEQVAGTYKAALDIMLNPGGQVADGLIKQVVIAKSASSDNAVDMTLKDFRLNMGTAEISLGNLSIENCALAATSVEGEYSFTASVVKSLDVFATGEPINCTITIEGGTVGNDRLAMNLGVALEGMPMTVDVACEGTKLSGTESSAASVTSFSLSGDVEAAEASINETEKTITVYVSDALADEDLAAVTPEVEVSEGATLSVASPLDLSKGSATLSVTSEDGSVTNVYTVTVSKVIPFDVLAGTYVCDLAVGVGEDASPDLIEGQKYNIEITKNGDNAIDMVLKNFSLGEKINLGDLSVKGCEISATENAGVYSFTGDALLEDLDIFGTGMMLADCIVNIVSATIDGENLTMSLDIDAALSPSNNLKVTVECTGTKQ